MWFLLLGLLGNYILKYNCYLRKPKLNSKNLTMITIAYQIAFSPILDSNSILYHLAIKIFITFYVTLIFISYPREHFLLMHFYFYFYLHIHYMNWSTNIYFVFILTFIFKSYAWKGFELLPGCVNIQHAQTQFII